MSGLLQARFVHVDDCGVDGLLELAQFFLNPWNGFGVKMLIRKLFWPRLTSGQRLSLRGSALTILAQLTQGVSHRC